MTNKQVFSIKILVSGVLVLFASSAYAQFTAIPDPAFEQALILSGIDKDGVVNQQVLTADISGVITLNVANKGINDLTGIAGFTALQILHCNNNNLTSLDLSANIALKTLNCYTNHLQSLNVTANINLVYLSAYENVLEELDVSANTQLQFLSCSTNDINELNVNANTKLHTLRCHRNNLTSLVLNGNFTALKEIKCGENNLKNLQLQGAPELSYVSFHMNDSLVSVDLSSNLKLGSQYKAYGSQLFSNGLVKATENPSLRCIQVANIISANKKIGDYSKWQKDPIARYSKECFPNTVTYVPDNAFEQFLIDMGYDMGPLDDTVATANIADILSLNVNAKGIGSLEGIADFADLKIVYCDDNTLTSLDLSHNMALQTVSCYGNKTLNSLIIGNKPSLTFLSCSDNALTSLDVSGCPNLTTLRVHTNQIQSLDVSHNPLLTQLLCYENSLDNLNVNQNPNLTELRCYDNDIQALDVTANVLLTALSCHQNEITVLDVSLNTALTELRCYGNDLTVLDVTNNTALTFLTCSDNALTALDVSHNTQLHTLRCHKNLLDTLNVMANTLLKELKCYDNNLRELYIGQAPELSYLDFHNNKLSSIDLSLYPLLGSVQYTNDEGEQGKMIAFENPYLKCIKVSNSIEANKKLGIYAKWEKDTWAHYAIDCSNGALTYVPDNSFEEALIALGYDTGPPNDTVLTININTVTFLDVSNKGIASLVGIQDFTSLETLYCNYNNLTTLNLSGNASLKTLSCHYNNITNLNVTQNDSLTFLSCSTNKLPNLNVTNNHALTTLRCHKNNLTALNLSNNIHLTELRCYENGLQSLNVSNNTALEFLTCSHNKLEELDVSMNINLVTLRCHKNDLKTLNVNNNVALKELRCYGNENLAGLYISGATALAYLDCSGTGLATINLGTNTLLGTQYIDYDDQILKNGLMDFRGNPSPACIELSNNEAVTKANQKIGAYANWKKDLGATYVVSCPKIYVPDDNFEQALIAGGWDDVLDDSLFTNAAGAITQLYLSNKNINDLTGLEHFQNLSVFNCANNPLLNGHLDLSANQALTQLDCSATQLTELNITANQALTYLNCSNNGLNTIDVSNNPALLTLNCSNNPMVGMNGLLDFTANTNLEYISCSSNQLKNLNVTGLVHLRSLDFSINQISFIDLSSLSELRTLNGSNNTLFNLDVSANPLLSTCQNIVTEEGEFVFCGALDATENPNLTCIQVSNIAQLEQEGWFLNGHWEKDEIANYSESCMLWNTVPDSEEYAALKAIYVALNGEQWGNKENWPVEWPVDVSFQEFSTWLGVVVSYGDVVGINLPSNNLTGEIPDDIVKLVDLTNLTLSQNNVFGEVPDLSELVVLGELFLEHNAITAIPVFKQHVNAQALRMKVEHNALAPAHIEANLNEQDTHNYSEFTYGNQANDTEAEVVVFIGQGAHELVNSQAGGLHTTYQWQKWNSELQSWDDIEDATEPSYSFVPTLDNYGEKYRCKMENDWITEEVFYSDIFIITIFAGELYAVADGSWRDQIWSTVQGGNVENIYPRDNDNVTIDGFHVRITTLEACKEIRILNSPESKLEVFGSSAFLTVNGDVIITGSEASGKKMLLVHNGGKLECK